MEKNISAVCEEIKTLSERSDDTCLIRQYEEQLLDFKRELEDIRKCLLPLDLTDDDELNVLQTNLEKALFKTSLQIRRLLKAHVSAPSTSERKGVRLPKLDVPTFDGNILNWRSFWEQFQVSVHDRSNLAESEKLVYLQHALKDGSAKQAIEGLFRSGEYYSEAIDCLQARYNRPRLIHRTHVRMILDAPTPKDGTEKELRKLHDTVQQHLRALKAMDYEPSGPFITSILELKLDVDTIFEWQKHSQMLYHTIKSFLNLSIFVPKPQNRLCQKTGSLQRVKSSGHIMYPVNQLHPSQQAQVPPWIIASYARQTSIPFILVPNSKCKRMTK